MNNENDGGDENGWYRIRIRFEGAELPGWHDCLCVCANDVDLGLVRWLRNPMWQVRISLKGWFEKWRLSLDQERAMAGFWRDDKLGGYGYYLWCDSWARYIESILRHLRSKKMTIHRIVKGMKETYGSWHCCKRWNEPYIVALRG